MTLTQADAIAPDQPLGLVGAGESPRSGVSWAAVLAGAFVAAATTLIFLALGSGLGFATASPWGLGPSAATFGVMAGIWLILTQWGASAVGGYLTGRLRTRWVSLHTHEVFFRDTAHGFLTWSVSTVMVALVLATAASLGAATATVAGAAQANGSPYAYQVDSLFRAPRPDDSPSAAQTRAEASRILATATAKGGMSANDRAYLATVISARTGISQADAQGRVDAAVRSIDDARKAAAATSIFTALAMLIGAFIACVGAAIGGQLRDEHA